MVEERDETVLGELPGLAELARVALLELMREGRGGVEWVGQPQRNKEQPSEGSGTDCDKVVVGGPFAGINAELRVGAEEADGSVVLVVGEERVGKQAGR